MLSQSYVKEILNYDVESGIFRWIVDKGNIRSGTKAGYKTPKGYVQIMIDKRPYFAHRLAWLYVYGSWPENIIDHIDGNRSNNLISNLRDVSYSENAQNQRLAHTTNKTKLLGVHYQKKTGKYRAQIKANSKTYFLGYFLTAMEAHLEYIKAKRILHIA